MKAPADSQIETRRVRVIFCLVQALHLCKLPTDPLNKKGSLLT